MRLEVFTYVLVALFIVGATAWLWHKWEYLPQPLIAALVIVIAVVVILAAMIGLMK